MMRVCHGICDWNGTFYLCFLGLNLYEVHVNLLFLVKHFYTLKIMAK